MYKDSVSPRFSVSSGMYKVSVSTKFSVSSGMYKDSLSPRFSVLWYVEGFSVPQV